VLRDSEGNCIGRACLGHTQEIPGVHDTGVITAGAFRASTQFYMPGILLGRPSSAARDRAQPIASHYRKELAEWADEQATMVNRIPVSRSALDMVYTASLLRGLGGATGTLPIARSQRGFVSFQDIAAMDLPDEIVLFRDWQTELGRYDRQEWSRCTLFPWVFGIETHHMRSLWFGVEDGEDFRMRADHPVWRRFCRSLSGAVMEAIALGWGVPLQRVLEMATVSTNEVSHSRPVGRVEDREILGNVVDVVRKPCV
jgi:hypothetical protein